MGLWFLWFYVQEHPKAQPAVVLVFKRLRRQGHRLKSHPTDGRSFVCLFDLILNVPSTIFQLNRDGSSWVEPVLSLDKCVLLKDHNAVTLVRLEPAASRSRVKHSTTEPQRSLLGEARNQTCDPWFTRHMLIPYTTAATPCYSLSAEILTGNLPPIAILKFLVNNK